jgi:hypothetical protein
MSAPLRNSSPCSRSWRGPCWISYRWGNRGKVRATGDFFLNAIESKGSDDEKALASVALKAVASPKISNRYALGLQKAVLSAIAAGISGPVAVTIADVGMSYFSKTYFFSGEHEPEYAMNNAFREGIAAIADEALKATTPTGFWQKAFHSLSAEKSLEIRANALNRIIGTMHTGGIEQELQQELGKILEEKPVSAAIQEGSAQSKVEQSDEFVEIDGLKIPKNTMGHLLKSR